MTAERVEAALRRARPALWVLAALLLGFVACRGALQPERGDTRFFQRGAERFATRAPLYTAVRGDPSSPNSGYTYPPPFALAARPTLWVSPRALRVLWPLAMAACALGGYLALSRWARASGAAAPETLVLLLTLTVCGRYVWNDLRHGQSNLLVVGLVCASLCHAQRKRDGWAGLALALALVIKPTAWPLGLWYLAQGRLRLVGLGALAGVMALSVPGVLYGPQAYAGELEAWVTRMRSFADEEALQPELVARGSTLLNAAASAWVARGLHALGVGDPIGWGRLAAWISGGLALGWTLWRRPQHGAAACVLLGAWLSPVTWKAHLVLLAIPGVLAARQVLARPTPLGWTCWGGWLALVLLPKLLPAAEAWGCSTLALAVGWVWCVKDPQGPLEPA